MHNLFKWLSYVLRELLLLKLSSWCLSVIVNFMQWYKLTILSFYVKSQLARAFVRLVQRVQQTVQVVQLLYLFFTIIFVMRSAQKVHTLLRLVFVQVKLLVEYNQVKLNVACSSSCKTCSGFASNCTSCLNDAPFLYNHICYAICPEGSYSSSNSCKGKTSKK